MPLLTFDRPVTLYIFKTISALRLMFGFYNQDLFGRGRVQYITKFCCLLKVFHATYIAISTESNESFNLGVVGAIEVAIYFGSSLICNACPISYFFDVQSRCIYRDTKSALLRAVLCPLLFSVFTTIMSAFILWSACRNMQANCMQNIVNVALYCFNWFTLEISKIPKLLCLGLLYCDVKSLQLSIRKIGFGSRNGHHSIDYVETFKSIRASFKKVEQPAKLMVLFNLLFVCGQIMVTLIEAVTDVRKFAFSPQVIRDVSTAFLVVYNAFAPVIILELIAQTEEDILLYVMDLRIASTESRTRNEMRRLLEYMRAQPLRYTLWRAVPLDARLALSLVSVAATYIIAVLQLTHAIN